MFVFLESGGNAFGFVRLLKSLDPGLRRDDGWRAGGSCTVSVVPTIRTIHCIALNTPSSQRKLGPMVADHLLFLVRGTARSTMGSSFRWNDGF